MATCDDKSGYDQVKLTKSSRQNVAIQFGGYLIVYNTLPLGLNASPVIYKTSWYVSDSIFNQVLYTKMICLLF